MNDLRSAAILAANRVQILYRRYRGPRRQRVVDDGRPRATVLPKRSFVG